MVFACSIATQWATTKSRQINYSNRNRNERLRHRMNTYHVTLASYNYCTAITIRVVALVWGQLKFVSYAL